jgi:predicted PurR-regulated permease PerM
MPNAEEPTYRDFVKQAKQLVTWATNIKSITQEDWDELTQKQQEEFYRQVTADQRWVRSTAERFFEW